MNAPKHPSGLSSEHKMELSRDPISPNSKKVYVVQLEKRVAFRRAMRQMAQRLQKSGIKGFKIQVSGRLNGAEIARAEWVREGRVPLQTIRADISYTHYEALTTYGILGIKVWIFDKEIFQK